MGVFDQMFGKNSKKETAKSVKPATGNAEKKIAKATDEKKAKPAAKAKAEEPKAAKAKVAAKATAAPAKAAKASADKAAKAPAAKPAAEKPAKKPESAEKSKAEDKKAITGSFEIKKSKDGKYVFNLYASNKVIVATSQVYTSANSAITGINSVINNAAKAPIEDQTKDGYETLPCPKWEVYRDKGGDFRFRLDAANGSTVCHSQGYTSKANCLKGIDSIIRSSANATIDKAYLEEK